MFKIFKKENTEKAEPMAFIFIGRSGCGKGTQVELFREELKKRGTEKVLHVETGSLLRAFTKTESFTSNLTKEVIYSGGLMPESIVIGLWIDYLINNFTGTESIMFDGAPRKLQEAMLLDGTLRFYGIKNVTVIHVNVSKDWAMKRLLGRGRKDDTEEGIGKRMAWFDKDVMPSIEFFKGNQDYKFVDINGEQSIEEVHAEIMKKVF